MTKKRDGVCWMELMGFYPNFTGFMQATVKIDGAFATFFEPDNGRGLPDHLRMSYIGRAGGGAWELAGDRKPPATFNNYYTIVNVAGKPTYYFREVEPMVLCWMLMYGCTKHVL